MKRFYFRLLVLTCVLAVGASASAQDGRRGGERGERGGERGGGERGGGERHGGWHGSSSFGGGFGGGAGFTPSIVADVLLVPSLTKAQQAKIRTLYYAHRTKSLDRMEVMGKLRGESHRRGRGESDGGGDSRGNGSPQARRQADAQAGMDASSANLRRTLFMSMMKEYEKFQQDLLAVLDDKQKKELKEIASKAGSPDYFKQPHYDKMNADKSSDSGKNRPD